MKRNSFRKASLSMLLVLSMSLSLIGCSKEKNDETPTGTPSAAPTEKVNTPTPGKNDTNPTEAPTPSPDDNVSASAPVNLMDNVVAGDVSGTPVSQDFIDNQMRLAIELFQASVEETPDENLLISPLSIQLALAMTANGADSNTLSQMEEVLGGELSIDELNEYLVHYINNLPSSEKSKLKIANSIWTKQNIFTPNPDFLQTNADYYAAEIFQAAFDSSTADAINQWASDNTDDMITKIVDKIPDDTVMYLINAIVFDAEWSSKYKDFDVRDWDFTSLSGEVQEAEMMCSEEHYYLTDQNATGFIKYYSNHNYYFAALLPNEGVDIYDYIAGLSAEGLYETLSNPMNVSVAAKLPKFSYEYELQMKDVLSSLGMADAFDQNIADFSEMGEANGNLYISKVLHKTFIEVDNAGTRAAAITSVEVATESIPQPPEYSVTLDRPFVYMLVDAETDLPFFMGILTEL